MLPLCAVLAIATPLQAQSLYKYRGENGEWIYADRPPADGDVDEVRKLAASASKGSVSVRAIDDGAQVRFAAENRYHIAIQVRLTFGRLENVTPPERELTWVLPPVRAVNLMEIDKVDPARTTGVEFQYEYIAGDPRARHDPPQPYRVPFAVATNYPVTQAYPDVVTHTTADSYYAVDIAMPIGTNVFAARDGVVFDVSSDNFQSGLNPDRDGPSANVVQIAHDDGTYAVYAHLNWNSIRVKPGERVTRGQYIADSGNTGFSSGPHLHFAVLRNGGLQTLSVPVTFEGADASAVTPASGNLLTAY
ncbi:MAG: M23 family metallopeptidase [Woeseiaceae bacterium]|nr:M23 family metallopeptidase [Woeseiaceae bacterium]